MKRLTAILLSILMIFLFASCGAEDILQSVADEQNKAITRGTIDGNIYTSEYAAITFTKPETWTYSTDEQIAEAMNVGADLLDQSKFQESITDMVSVYDMMVSDPTTGTNIYVSYENLKLTNNTTISLDGYLDSLESQYTSQSIFEVTIGDRVDATIGEQSYKRASYVMNYNGIEMDQYAYVRKINSFMSVIIVTVCDDTPIAEIEAMFS